MYERKVNGRVSSGEFLTGNLQFYTVTTTNNILPLGVTDSTADSQKALDKLIEILALNGQPVILHVYKSGSNFILKYANEHTDAWESTTVLADAIAAHGVDFGFTSSNVTVTKAENL